VRLRGPPLSLPYLSLSVVASNLSSILLFLVKLYAFSPSIRGKAASRA
jgi:hypothetical protein